MIINWGLYRGCEIALVEDGEITKMGTLTGHGLPDVFYDLWVLEIMEDGTPEYARWSTDNAKLILKNKKTMPQTDIDKFTAEFDLAPAKSFDEAFSLFCDSYAKDFDSYVNAISFIINLGYDGDKLIEQGLAIDADIVKYMV